MVNLRDMFSFKAICTIFMLLVFSVTSATPAFVDRPNYIINEGIAIYKINRIKEKMSKFNHATSQKDVIDTMLEIRSLVFEQTGKSVDLSDAIHQAKSNMKSKGYTLDKKTWKSLEKLISKREQKFQSKLFHKAIADASEKDFDEDEFESLYENIYGKDTQEDPVSLEVTLGVTFVLCSILMFCIPVPICQTIGLGFFEAGCYFLGGEGWEHIKDYTENK